MLVLGRVSPKVANNHGSEWKNIRWSICLWNEWFGARWFGFLESPYGRDCYLGAPLEELEKSDDLDGGWTNPSEKYESLLIENLPWIGLKISQYLKPPPSDLFVKQQKPWDLFSFSNIGEIPRHITLTLRKKKSNVSKPQTIHFLAGSRSSSRSRLRLFFSKQLLLNKRRL